MSALLQLLDVSAYYGQACAVRELSLDIGPGEVVALLGRNGAGKSTTQKSIIGLVEKKGIVRFAGQDISKSATHQIARLGLGYVPEGRRIFADLTVLENLEVGRRKAPQGQNAWSVERIFSLFPNLAAMPQRLGSRMSGGEQQMLAVARTLMGNPRLILLDEPTEGLAPLMVSAMARAIETMKEAGLAILLSEQNSIFARRLADRAVVLENGQTVFAGPIDTFLDGVQHAPLRQRALGVS